MKSMKTMTTITKNTMAFNLQFFAWSDVTGGGSSEKLDYVKFVPGSPKKLRILDAEPFSRWTHWFPAQKRSVTCGGTSCPVCAVIKAQRAQKMTPQYNSSQRHILHVWDYDTKQIMLLEGGTELFKQLGAYIKIFGDVRSLDITFMRNGTGTSTSYTLIPGQQEPISQEIQTAYETKKLDFETRYTPTPVEQLQMYMEGKSVEEIYAKPQDNETTPTHADSMVSFVTE